MSAANRLDEIEAEHATDHPYCGGCPLTALVAAVRGVLDLHEPDTFGGEIACRHCSDERDVFYPCSTVLAITTALGGAA